MQINLAKQHLKNKALIETSEILKSCVRCGMCLTACPSYLATKDERHSPRGRIYLVKQILESNYESNQDLAELSKYFETCLTCLSCQTTCPSNVVYSDIIDYAREATYPHRNKFKSQTILYLISTVTSGRLLKRLIFILQSVSFMIKPFLFGKLRSFYNLLPNVSFEKISETTKFSIQSREVYLFSGCVERELAPIITNSMIRLCHKLKININLLSSNCCGALHHHNGFDGKSKISSGKLKQEWFGHFLKTDQKNQIKNHEVIYTVSGCGSQLTKIVAKDLSDKVSVFETGEWLNDNIVQILKIISKRKLAYFNKKKIVFHPPCSLSHSVKRLDENLNFLRKIGLKFEIPNESNICCGSAGIYNIQQNEIAVKLQERKVCNIQKLQPDIIVSNNLACLEQIRSGKLKNNRVKFFHIAELIAKLV